MKAHRTDWLSLSFGLIFLTIVVAWQLSDVVTLGVSALGWLAASALILFGVIGLLGALRSGRDRSAPVPEAAAIEPDTDLPPEVHAGIVRELLTDPTTRLSTTQPAAQPTVAATRPGTAGTPMEAATAEAPAAVPPEAPVTAPPAPPVEPRRD